MWMDMCIMELQMLLKLSKSRVRVWVAKILKVGHGLFKIKRMATERLYEHRQLVQSVLDLNVELE